MRRQTRLFRRPVALPAIIPAVLILAGCSSGNGAATTSTEQGPAVLGATDAMWQTGHPRDTATAGASGYGPTVSINGRTVDQFTAVQEQNGRVIGWHMTFPAGTDLAKAEALVRAQLPSDIRQTASGRNTFGGGGGYCEFVDFQSQKLATELNSPAPTGSESNVGVTLYESTPHPSDTTGIAKVNSADIGTTPRASGQGC